MAELIANLLYKACENLDVNGVKQILKNHLTGEPHQMKLIG
jgi:hypothetical protein